jgi:hypothetical protein
MKFRVVILGAILAATSLGAAGSGSSATLAEPEKPQAQLAADATHAKSNEATDRRVPGTQGPRHGKLNVPEPAASLLVSLGLIIVSIVGKRLAARGRQNADAGKATEQS